MVNLKERVFRRPLPLVDVVPILLALEACLGTGRLRVVDKTLRRYVL